MSEHPTTESRRKGRARTTARDVPPAIQWHEGMLLAPQHFQWLSLRHETLLHYHAAAISPFHWGVRHLVVDNVKLVDGVFRVEELEAVMPDGLIISHSAGDLPDLSIDLAEHAELIQQRPMMIFLAVAIRGRGLALSERYGSEEGGPVPDENTGEGDLPLPVLKPRLHLLLGDDPPNKYVGFPIAEVAYRNEVFTRTRFEPPWLRVSPGSAIYDTCASIATRLREKAAFLADQVRSPSASARVPQLLETKSMVHYLVGELPAFEAVLRANQSHPFPLFVALCSLLGHVAGLGRSLLPPVLEPYDHNNLFATFEQARAAIGKAIDEGVNESYSGYPFSLEGDEFRLLFDPAWNNRTLILGVRAAPGVPEIDTVGWMASALIGSQPVILSLRDRRVSGAPRKRIDGDGDLVPSRGVTLFSFTPDPEVVIAGEELVILNPGGGRRPEEIVLFVKNRV
ncbi:MAG TPA: type VI secretion system baseplate subunit TssK [Thermoanaerobaculia bacterium]|jgi:type VI secretion system protein ImpJ|nr:type VI secretion system baseplate subunit TssK [Thermoanaerobaculia bacterium]